MRGTPKAAHGSFGIIGEKMTGYDLYVFILCIVAFASSLLLFGTMLFIIVHQKLRAIDNGLLDYEIKKEYMRKRNSEDSSAKIVFGIVSAIVSVLVIAVFAWVISIKFADPKVEGSVPAPRVVLSDSMSYKNKANAYLEQNNLNDQFDTFDLILTHELPNEFELELYDVVVYEIESDLVVHRIIEIEEPNAEHPEHRLFRLRGDAVKYSDEHAVKYSQMKSVYRGEKIPFVGSFVYFLQSPAGYVCIILIIFAFILAPIIELIIWKRKRDRYNYIVGDKPKPVR